MKTIAKWRLIVWIGILLTALISLSTALVVVKPVNNVDCKKAMALWNYSEGQAAIEAFKGNDMKAQLLQGNYKRLVTGENKVCFPPALVEYILQNK